MIIDISLFESGKVNKIEFDETYGLKENPFAEAGIKFISPIRIAFTAVIAGNDYIVNGFYSGEMELDCDKCGEKFNYQSNGDFVFVIMYEIPDDLKDDADTILVENTKKIDLKDRIRESILINLPVSNLCKKNCRGLCPVCGTNLNKKKCGCGIEQTNSAFDDALKIFNN
ncbi:MAG TPA: DUF177 domain-containing protein [bacterium]|nr:DUF177 domain-containing protein [bacterium]HPN32120.1 DUF177 domain-containing protein [bacterium]